MPYLILSNKQGAGTAVPDQWVSRSSLSLVNTETVDSSWGLAISPDGTTIVSREELGNPYAKFVEYTLSTPYDISTKSTANTKTRGSAGWLRDMSVIYNDDGSALWFGHGNNLYRYDISNYSISAMGSTADGYYSNFFTTGPDCIRFSADGTKFYYSNGYHRWIRQYALSTPWDITSLSNIASPEATFDTSTLPSWVNGIPVGNKNINCFQIDPSGNSLALSFVASTTNNLYRVQLSTPWDISSVNISTIVEIGVLGGNGNIRSWVISDDGANVYYPTYSYLKQYSWT